MNIHELFVNICDTFANGCDNKVANFGKFSLQSSYRMVRFWKDNYYKVVFWAQFSEAMAYIVDPYYIRIYMHVAITSLASW